MTITTAEKQLSSPRELCKSEKESLCQLIRDVLNVDPSNDEDIEDADILIEYVCDMIDEKDSVGQIMKEVSCNECYIMMHIIRLLNSFHIDTDTLPISIHISSLY